MSPPPLPVKTDHNKWQRLMENSFKLPDEGTGNNEALRRVSDLIEEIRADIDFELDDAVTDIVRDLPEEYFERMSHEIQVTHLKGLIASRICELNGELYLPTADGSQIAVLGRNSYRGQLANILSELPGMKTRLVGANIYTARSHGFILDVFEFETDQHPAVDASFSGEVIEKLSQATDSDSSATADFLSRIRTTRTKSPNLEKLARFFSVFQKVSPENPIAADQKEGSPELLDIVIAIHAQNERATFQRTTESLSGLSLDVEQAELIIVRFENDADEPKSKRTDKTVLMNFLISCSDVGSFEIKAWAKSLHASLM